MNIGLENSIITQQDSFNITLSVSKQTVHSKAEGGKITVFETLSLDTTDENQRKQIFTSRNYSTNVWNSTCSNDSYIGMTGVTLDFDGSMSIDQARELFSGYHHILHTSASHQVKEPKGDRFRVILPFAPGPLRFVTAAECRQVYRKLQQMYPQVDPACADPARKYFPHTQELDAEFILDVNDAGRYFDIDISEMSDNAVEHAVVAYAPPEELNTKEELDRMLKLDRFIPWCQQNANAGLPEPLWYAMISNLCRFDGGCELIHAISKQDPVAERYDPAETDAKIEHALASSGPMGYQEIVRRGWPGEVPMAPLAPAGWAKIGRIQNRKSLFPSNKNPDIYLEHDDWIIVDDNGMKSAVPFAELKHKAKDEGCTIAAVCPICDHGSATIRANTFHFAYLHCGQCNRSYWEHPDSPELFTYNGDLLRVEMKGDRFISHEKLKAVNFRTNEEWTYACQKVMNDPRRRFIGDSFTINRIGSADFDKLGYELRGQDNAVVFKFPAVPVQVQDNSLIDNFLDTMFGRDSGFIKDWMALYAFTNYVSLPVIVLTGPRSCGKNTFADLVGDIFPSLKSTWDGDKEQFNDFAVKKLVFIDENRNSEKPTQYAEIKRLTGNRTVKVNEKHIRQYYVRNNTKFIFATNDPRPIALHWREEPDSSKTNNFFIYACPAVPVDKIDRELFDKLRARLGYYVRTELKKRYETWRLSGGISSRYALDTPITDLARKLFGSSKSLIEMEAEELAQHLVCGIHRVDTSTPYHKTIYFSPIAVDGSLFVQQQDLRELIQKLNFKGIANYKAYITALQDQGVLSHRNNHRISNQRLGYQILRSPDYYTATDSGGLPVEEVMDSTALRNAILEVPSISSDTRIFE
ncbi:hypothetical protein KKH27_02910 [bacterium]|nr:hypothetical protein [bacterium]